MHYIIFPRPQAGDSVTYDLDPAKAQMGQMKAGRGIYIYIYNVHIYVCIYIYIYITHTRNKHNTNDNTQIRKTIITIYSTTCNSRIKRKQG